MIEPEMAFADLADDADLAEAFLKRLCIHALNSCDEDMQFFNAQIDKGLISRIESVANASFARMEYGEAIERLKKAPASFQFPVEWGSTSSRARALPDRTGGRRAGLHRQLP